LDIDIAVYELRIISLLLVTWTQPALKLVFLPARVDYRTSNL